jgi:glycosyltransferase involved in cell wall biosynthesis
MTKPLAHISSLFLVWSHPQGSHRSQFFAEIFGMRLQYVYFTRRRGAFWAALKYPVQALQTIWVMFKYRPKLVFIQDPPTPAAFVVWLCSLILPIRFVIDTHTQKHLLVDYNFLWGMRRFVARRALTNIVTNEHLAKMIREWGGVATVMEDPPLPLEVKGRDLEGDFRVVWVNVGAMDEPRDVFFEAARQLPEIRFYVTSDYQRNEELRQYQAKASENVHFTGHLPDEDYYSLLKSADVVLTLTTRNHTLQQGACEAMWLGRPVITSDWSMLREYFPKGALFVDNRADSLVEAIRQMREDLPRYQAEIVETAALKRADWDRQVGELLEIIGKF